MVQAATIGWSQVGVMGLTRCISRAFQKHEVGLADEEMLYASGSIVKTTPS